MAAGTYALACHAGLPFVGALEAAVAVLAPPSPHDLDAIWHVGQVASVLGERSPDWVRSLCDAELASERWAPWSTRAAFVRGDRAAFALGCKRLVRGLSHELVELPTAVVAASLEVLALEREESAETARAIEHASAHLCVRQLASGAFPLTLDDQLLRVDVTAHALLALLPALPLALPHATNAP
jgi:hypothetical protein